MEVSFLPIELSSVEALQCSLIQIDETMSGVDNKVYLYHGPNSVVLRGNQRPRINGVIKPERTLVDLIQEDWQPYKDPFRVHPFLCSEHLQTLYAAAPTFTSDHVYYARKLLKVPDGGTVSLDIVLESETHFKKGLRVDEEIKRRKDYVKNLPWRTSVRLFLVFAGNFIVFGKFLGMGPFPGTTTGRSANYWGQEQKAREQKEKDG